MDALTNRNFQALSEGLKDLRTQLETLKEDNKKKDAIIAQQNITLESVQQRVNVLYAKSMGSGATA